MEPFQTNWSGAMEFLRLARIVLSSFVGVRNRAAHEADIASSTRSQILRSVTHQSKGVVFSVPFQQCLVRNCKTS
jgi:hypothetical protein